MAGRLTPQEFANLPPELQAMLIQQAQQQEGMMHGGGGYPHHPSAGGHHHPGQEPHVPREVEEQLVGHQKYMFMAFQYGVKAIDITTVALKWGWLPFVLAAGCSSWWCGPTLNPLEYVGLAKPAQPQQQSQAYIR